MLRGNLPGWKSVVHDLPWAAPADNTARRDALGIADNGPVFYATGPGYPGPYDVFIPTDISNRVRIGFSRAPNKFHFPKYWQYVETPTMVAYYLKITTQEAARVVNVQDFVWPDGQPDRTEEDGTESFNFIPFATQRYRYGARLGDLTASQAVWPIVEQHAGIKASQLMTNRTIRGCNAATTASTWQVATNADNTANLVADHTATAAAMPGVGGFLDQGTATSPFIKLALGYIADLINQDTIGVIDSDPDQFFVIVNPGGARLMASSPEIHQYIESSVWAMDEIRQGAHPNGKYGLPSKLYGFTLLVENTVQVNNQKLGTLVRSYPFPNQTLLVASRVGGLDGIYGAPSFSTLTMFWFQNELTVETKKDNWDRLTYIRTVENTYEAVTCTASGYLVTQAFSQNIN